MLVSPLIIVSCNKFIAFRLCIIPVKPKHISLTAHLVGTIVGIVIVVTAFTIAISLRLKKGNMYMLKWILKLKKRKEVT